MYVFRPSCAPSIYRCIFSITASTDGSLHKVMTPRATGKKWTHQNCFCRSYNSVIHMDIDISHGKHPFPGQMILQDACPYCVKELINRGERSTFAINSLLDISDWQDSSCMDASVTRCEGINTHFSSSRNFAPPTSSVLTQPFLLNRPSLVKAVFQHNHLINFSNVSSWFTTWKCSYRLPFYEEQLVANQTIESTSYLPETLNYCSHLHRRCFPLAIRSSPALRHEVQSRDIGRFSDLTSFEPRLFNINILSPYFMSSNIQFHVFWS